jgi:hypothetical protein
MPRLHQRTRRRLCQGLFLAFGVLPTLAVIGWCIERHLPGQATAEAERLAALLDLDVKLEGVRRPRPGAVLYEGLTLCDPETSRPLLQCRLLEASVAWRKDHQGRLKRSLELIASQPRIEADQLPTAWSWLRTLLGGRFGRLPGETRLAAAELTLQTAEDAQTLTDIDGLVETLADGTNLEIQFRLVGAEAPERARIRIVRNRQVSPPAGGFELYTGGGELPCSLLAMGLTELRPLGPRCRFRGYIWANQTADGWEGEVTGSLAELDLERLLGGELPHHLGGSGQLTVQRAVFRKGRLAEANVALTAGPGTIDRSLARAAIERLGLRPGSAWTTDAPDAASPANERIAYRELAFAATLDADGLRLQGRCSDAPPGTVLAVADGGLLGEPSQSRPVAALAQTLVPRADAQAPVSRQTDWLLRRLPLPEARSLGGDDVPPTARLRPADPRR